jgi:PAS domain S-box-containing protein
MSIFLGQKMVAPLREMTKKAIQISEGQKDLLFENSDSNYWEFNQLSQAFNYMLSNLKDAEEKSRYKELLENVDDAVYILDREGNVLDANEAAYSQLGYTPEKFFKLNLTDIISQTDARIIITQLGQDSQFQGPKKMTLETSHKKADGNSIPVEIHSRAITYRGRNVILNVARDITERVEVEKALRESEERYRSVVEYSHDGIMIIDEKVKMLYANDVLARILGYTPAELRGSNFSSYLDDESATLAIERFLDPKREEYFFSPQVYKIICKNGEERSVKISANRFQDSKGNEKTVAQIMDITDQLRSEQEKKHLETQLIHSQKMEAIGTLAGGIAHDFNNLLMGMQGYISLMRLQTESKDQNYEYIQGIENAVMSAANLTNQLLGFARKGKYTLKSTCLNTVVENSSKMFTRTKKEIVVQKKLQPDIWNVRVDPGQIEQVLINLYLNAWHAMPDGGDLFIQTENIYLSDDYCQPFEIPGGNYVKISVTDTGVGIDKELISRIFEPFFTTKDVGKGTGLGLASAYGIIKNHSGIIRVYSEKGQGSTFNIYLPASGAEQETDVRVNNKVLKGKETILLVDDEEGTIQVEGLMLKELGYKVVPAKSGKEAIELYKDNMLDLDLVALDMIMPEMSGSDTYDELKKINPDVKVLLVSGYGFSKKIEELMDQGCAGFIQKPFDIVQLSQKIRKALES